MKHFCIFLLCLGFSFAGIAQTTIPKIDLSNRASDHFVIQLSSDRWLGAPDSINSRFKNNSRGINVYFMLDKPFKSNPKYSVAAGLCISSSHIFLNKMTAAINGTSGLLNFQAVDTVSRFDKYKISTSYVEIPLELRYFSKPDKPNAGFKVAIGVKVGALINAHTKGKTLVSASGSTLQDYSTKITSKNYFNTTRLSATAKLGYGNFGIFGSYNLTSVFKDKVAADMKLLQLGITISGL
jgi:hypothetical protein